MGAQFACPECVNEPGTHPPKEPAIEHAPLGYPGDHAPREFLGLYLYLAAMAAFLVWLVVFGVNV
jgi:hypothetical protein